MSTITHAMLVARATAWLRRNGFKVALPELYTTATGEIPDAWGLNSGGTSCIIEVKVSRADFLRDRKKYFRRRPEAGMGNLRYYMAPVGIINLVDLPEGWGLLAVHGRIIRREREAALPFMRVKVDQTDKAFLYPKCSRGRWAVDKSGGVVCVSVFAPMDLVDMRQNTEQPWFTPIKYEPGKEYRMRNGTRLYIADNNGALRRVREVVRGK